MENSILDKTITMCERVNMPDKVAAVNLLSVLKTNKYKVLANACNGLGTKEERRNFKFKNVPVITVGGLFNKYRSEANLLQHSGLICLDLDGVKDIISLKERITKLPFISYCGCSISGTGLFVIIPIPVSTPKEHFNRYAALEMYFIKNFGIIGTVDPQPKNIAAARFVSYDPDAYFNHSAIIYDELPQPVIYPKAMPVIRQYKANTDNEKVWAMVTIIQERRLDFAPDYSDYLRTAFSLANGLGEAGRQAFHAVCQYSALYNFTDAEEKYNEALKNKNGKVSLATFFGYCKDFGLMPEKKLLNPLPVYVAKPIERSYPKERENILPDIADLLIRMDWKDFRKSEQSEPPGQIAETKTDFTELLRTDFKPDTLSKNVEKCQGLKKEPEPITFTIPEPVINIKPQKQEPPKEHFLNRENWTPELIELEKYFKTVSLPAMVQLNKAAKITNVPLFIDTHFQTLNNYNGNKTFLPYLKRLKDLKQFIVNNN